MTNVNELRALLRIVEKKSDAWELSVAQMEQNTLRAVIAEVIRHLIEHEERLDRRQTLND